MALRLIQIKLPDVDQESILEMIEDQKFVTTWLDHQEPGQLILQLIATAEACEAIMDKFDQRFHGISGFHILLLPVEAVLPRLSEQEDPDKPLAASRKEDTTEKKHRISREELYSEIEEGLKIGPVFLAMTVLSSIVAAIGLLRNDLAVIIGAMVIAPLLTANVALSLSAALGDTELACKAFKTNIIGVSISFFFAIGVGLVFNVASDTPAIATRTLIGSSDLILALAAGSAGTLAFTTGVPGTLIGVMVAVALLPPLVTCGMLLGDGEFMLSLRAFLLAAVNVICVNIAGVITFALQGVRPRTWWEAEKAKKATIKVSVALCTLFVVLILILLLTKYKMV
jgi:uncharacterized hydrophobic protein (TIGR00341 family)